MMKKTLFFASLMVAAQLNFAQDWKPVNTHILTPWAEKITPRQPHPEYPRPQLIRSNNWQNLNGLWKYAVTGVDTKEIPAQWDGQILVPFAIESALSGVGKQVGKDKALWYYNVITLDKSVSKNKVLLHF